MAAFFIEYFVIVSGPQVSSNRPATETTLLSGTAALLIFNLKISSGQEYLLLKKSCDCLSIPTGSGSPANESNAKNLIFSQTLFILIASSSERSGPFGFCSE